MLLRGATHGHRRPLLYSARELPQQHKQHGSSASAEDSSTRRPSHRVLRETQTKTTLPCDPVT